MLEGIVRESIGKSAVKVLRRDGYLIANLYGKDSENIHCAFKLNEFIKAVKTKDSLFLPIKVGGKEYQCVVVEYQKDPVTDVLIHVDLKVVTKGQVSKFKIPVAPKGTPKGLRNKGVFIYSRKRIAVKAAPEKLPANYEFDVAHLDVGDAILIRDLPAIEGVEILENPAQPIVGVIKAK